MADPNRADIATTRVEAAIARNAGWQLQYDMTLLVQDRKRLLTRIAELETKLAEHQRMRERIAGLRTEYGVSWRPRGTNANRPWIDDDIDGMTEADAKAHAATRPEGRVMERLVGRWQDAPTGE